MSSVNNDGPPRYNMSVEFVVNFSNDTLSFQLKEGKWRKLMKIIACVKIFPKIVLEQNPPFYIPIHSWKWQLKKKKKWNRPVKITVRNVIIKFYQELILLVFSQMKWTSSPCLKKIRKKTRHKSYKLQNYVLKSTLLGIKQ